MKKAAKTSPPESQRTDYFERVPKWSKSGQCFDVLSDKISGRIPVTRVDSWREFANLLEGVFFNRKGVQLVYRGQRRHDWNLTPSLGRLTASGIVSKELGDRQLAHFKRAVRGRVADRTLVDDGEEDELWSVGQHHELMTPLLDWTYSPYVALFFAFAKEDSADQEETENPYRVVYVLNKTFVSDEDQCPDIRVMEPRKDDHGRLVNQAGLFTFSPFDATIENKLADILSAENFPDERLREADETEQPDILAKYICKIYIKNEGRDACLRHLRRMNVHHASLFPDLLGAAAYCNITIAEEEWDLGANQKPVTASTKNKNSPVVSAMPALPTASGFQNKVRITNILKRPHAAKTVEPGRITIIVDQLQNELGKHLVVDWETRDSIKAKLRNTARIILRKYGYPSSIREDVVNKIIEALAKTPHDQAKPTKI